MKVVCFILFILFNYTDECIFSTEPHGGQNTADNILPMDNENDDGNISYIIRYQFSSCLYFCFLISDQHQNRPTTSAAAAAADSAHAIQQGTESNIANNTATVDTNHNGNSMNLQICHLIYLVIF